MAAKRGRKRTPKKGPRPKAAKEEQGGESDTTAEQLRIGNVATQREVAGAFGVTVRTVRSWVAEGMPRARSGAYNLIDIQAWRDSRNGSARAGISTEHQKAETDWRTNRARKVALEVAKMEGELVDRRQVEKRMAAQALVLRRKLLAWYKRLPPILQGMTVREMEATLKEHINDLLRSFADDEAPKELEGWPAEA